MAAADNLAMNRRIFDECWNKGNLSVLDDVLAANYIEHDPSIPGGILDLAAFKQNVTMYRAAFQDVQFTIDEQSAIGDNQVITRWSARGTNTGPLLGMPATGKQALVTGLTLSRFENGKGVEAYTNWDTFGLLQQLGAIPAMAPQPSMQSAMQPPAH